MLDSTRTTTALLDGLHDEANAEVWELFDRRYRPIVIGFAKRLGLSDVDAADVAQETLTRFLTEHRANKYDRERGRLRSWLVGIARSRVAQMRRTRATKREWRGESAFVDLSDEATLTQAWDTERRLAMLREALTSLRDSSKTSEKTIEAFEMLMVQQQPAPAVAEALGMSTHDVYLAKNRIATKLRDILATLDRAYDEEA